MNALTRFLSPLGWALCLGALAVIAGGAGRLTYSRYDAGWQVNDCGDTTWQRELLPLSVYIEAGDGALEPAVKEAIARWNAVAPLYKYRGVTDPFVAPAYPAVYVRLARDTADEEREHKHGLTQYQCADWPWLHYGKHTVGATITVPLFAVSQAQLQLDTVTHELGHGLRLADDNLDTSIMHIRLETHIPRAITADDIQRLQGAYAPNAAGAN